MEVTKKLQKLSLAALIVSLLPLATLVPVFLKITRQMVYARFRRSVTSPWRWQASCSP